jgi:acyl carrier protein
MDRQNLENDVCALAGSILEYDIRPESLLLADKGLIDSLNIARLVAEVEERFGVSFEDDLELDFLDSIASLVAAIDARLAME